MKFKHLKKGDYIITTYGAAVDTEKVVKVGRSCFYTQPKYQTKQNKFSLKTGERIGKGIKLTAIAV